MCGPVTSQGGHQELRGPGKGEGAGESGGWEARRGGLGKGVGGQRAEQQYSLKF
jgi:hypothetical protein